MTEDVCRRIHTKRSSILLTSLPVILAILLFSIRSEAATVNFSGFLGLVDLDSGGAIYSGVPEGTSFSGFIDDVTFNGQISGGGITTPFSCCIAAGALGISNNEMLGVEAARILNALVGNPTAFSANDVFDIVDLEGDEVVPHGAAGDGRIEIGVSYLLDQNAFNDESPSNYPFDPADLFPDPADLFPDVPGVFFIVEEDPNGDDIYAAFGLLQPIPVPAAVWLFGSGLLGLIGMARRRRS